MDPLRPRARTGLLRSGATILAVLAALLSIPTISPAQCVLSTFTGASPGDAFGWSVAGLGDVDGDGAPEIAVGAPFADPGGISDAGQATVISGATGAMIRTLDGTVPGGYFGWTVADTGDVDGDLVPDLIVGAPFTAVGGSPIVGQAKVFSGSSGALLFTFSGAAANQSFGNSVAGPGDVTGDLTPDFLIGVSHAAPGGSFNKGQAKVFSGNDGTLVQTFEGTGAGDRFGSSVGAAGDVDGDGTPDLLVGAIQTDAVSGTVGPGYARVHSGATGAPLLTVAGAALGDGFGWSVASPGDVNGDSVPDLLIGARLGAPLGMSQAGYARMFSGAGGGVLFTVNGLGPGDGLGGYVAGTGDLDGDGIPDFAVGAPELASAPGPIPTGYVLVRSGSNGAPLLTLTGSDDTFGWQVAGVGDLNGDGVPELAVGAPLHFTNGAGEVKVFLVGGGTSPLGTGCAGSGGFVPVAGTTGGGACAPSPSFALTLSNALGGSLAILLVGGSSSSWVGFPLPANLAALGMPSCSLLVSAEFTFLAVTSGVGPGAGAASVGIPIPADPALVGGTAYVQWYVVDPGPVPFAFFPGAMSAGLQVQIG